MRTDGCDYLIIDAGSAGCVLVNRLSGDPACRLLLLEAGGSDALTLCAGRPAAMMGAHSA